MRTPMTVTAVLLSMLLAGCAGVPRHPASPPPAPLMPPASPAPTPAPLAPPASPAPTPAPPAPPASPVPTPEPGAAPDPSGITPEEAAAIPPLEPAGVNVEKDGDRVTVHWRGSGNASGRYEVYRRAGPTAPWTPAAKVAATGSDTDTYRWADPAPVVGAVYGVAAVSPYGVKSAIVSP